MAEDANDPRIHVILHNDFTEYSAGVLAQLRGASGCVWALGTGQNAQGVRQNHDNLRRGGAQAFATLAPHGGPFHFVFVSGGGATFEPGLFTPLYARVKGETEMALAAARKANARLRANTVRPGFVDWVDHDVIKPYVSPRPVVKQTAITLLGPIYRTAFPGKCSPSQPLGKFLTEMAMGKWETEISGPGFEKIGEFAVVNNDDFRRLSGLE
ncbi:hypothetical protein OQA88_11648 [Cercophora sp. LCS_1]